MDGIAMAYTRYSIYAVARKNVLYFLYFSSLYCACLCITCYSYKIKCWHMFKWKNLH